MKIFGFTIGESRPTEASPIAREAFDTNAAIKIESNVAGGFINSHINAISVDSQTNTENENIEKYRDIIFVPEVDQCIEEIVGDAIISSEDGRNVELDLSQLGIPDATKKKMIEQFEVVYDLLMFNRRGHDIFKRWYVDGRLNYFVHINRDAPNEGIASLQYVDPRKIKKIREVSRAYDQSSQTMVVSSEREYFIYNERGIGSAVQSKTSVNNMSVGMQSQDIIIASDSVVFVPSGITDPQSGLVISHLHKALRPATNLRMMEDATLIYRLSRAPERRVFYIDTGNLPKAKAEQYVQEIANKQRSKIVYDVNTGEIKNDKKYMALTEDFWLPRKEGSRGTEIDTLQGGQQVGEMGESEYFKNKLYVAMNVPQSRFAEQPSMFSSGTDITRDELRFGRFVSRVRSNFNVLFDELLRIQCTLTGVFSNEDWSEIRSKIVYKYEEDNHFTESVKQARLEAIGNILAMFDQFVGKYVSREYVYKNILDMTDDEMKQEQKFIKNDAELQQQLEDARNAQLGIDPNAPDQGQDSGGDDPSQVTSGAPSPGFVSGVSEELISEMFDMKESEVALNEALTNYLKNNV